MGINVWTHIKNMGPRIWVYFWKLEKYGSMQYGSIFENTKIWVETIWDHYCKNSSIGAIWKYGFKNMGPFFKIVKNMGLCNMGSFLKIRKYGSKQYGSISENWTHIGLSKYGLKNYLCPPPFGCLPIFPNNVNSHKWKTGGGWQGAPSGIVLRAPALRGN